MIASSSNDVANRDIYRQLLYDTVIAKRIRVSTRNNDRRIFSLIAKEDIHAASFVGFFTGSMSSNSCPPGSIYALQIGRSEPCITPFQDETHITSRERDMHLLASMNEPREGESANCHMIVQDFTHAEVENVSSIVHSESARFFRGVACFACETIPAGAELTWNYGKAYEPIREREGYVAGNVCKAILAGERFINSNSQTVLDALTRVPPYCVYPVLRSQVVSSERFKSKRPRTSDSDEDVSDSFSSGSDPQNSDKYLPRPSRSRSA